MGVVLPSNSPGVHSLWAPATVLKMPLVLKPGSAEPWTPLRMIHAWIKAGAPADAFAYYPTDHAGGNEILRSTGRGMVFGDVGSTKRWKADGRVEVHGPGYSKVVIGPDVADQWEQYIDVIAESMSNNGGRSCVNASGVWVTKHADAIAEALAKKLSPVIAASRRRSGGGAGAVCGSGNRAGASRRRSTATWTAARRHGARRAMSPRPSAAPIASRHAHGGTYLLPTVIRCDADHPLANREFLFPFASVVEVPADGSARLPRTVAGRDLHLERSGVPRALRRLTARRSPELRPAVDDADRVGSAARRQSVRASVRAPRDPAAGVARSCHPPKADATARARKNPQAPGSRRRLSGCRS